MNRILQGAFDFLVDNYEPGHEISFFGFGRGCHAVSALCENLEWFGTRYGKTFASEWAWETRSENRRTALMSSNRADWNYPACRYQEPIRVHFVGLFDAVDIKPQLEECSTSKLSLQGRVVRHAIAMDEKPICFRPTPIDDHIYKPYKDPSCDGLDGEDYGQSLEQMWFPGSHQLSQSRNPSRGTEILRYPGHWRNHIPFR